jgi:hypothetical protein
MSQEHKLNFGQMMIQNRSKKTCLKIASYVGSDSARFEELVNAFFQSSGKEQNLIMWAINHTIDQHPYLFISHLTRFVHFLDPGRSEPVKRGIIRILRDVPLNDEEILGEVYTKCFEMVSDPKEPIAVRAFGIKVLTKIAKELPELKEELIPLFQDIYELTEKGLQNSAKNSLNELRKLP